MNNFFFSKYLNRTKPQDETQPQSKQLEVIDKEH